MCVTILSQKMSFSPERHTETIKKMFKAHIRFAHLFHSRPVSFEVHPFLLPSLRNKQKYMININTETLISTTQFSVMEECDGLHERWLPLQFSSAHLGVWVLSRTGPSPVTMHSCFRLIWNYLHSNAIAISVEYCHESLSSYSLKTWIGRCQSL